MFSKSSIIYCALTVLLVVYLCIALPVTASMERSDIYHRVLIPLSDTTFVNAAGVASEGGNLLSLTATPRSELDLGVLERRLCSSDKLEQANISVLNDGTLLVEVTPMVPVARVYGRHGSYYINAQGKRIGANRMFHIDVPLVGGTFTDSFPPERLLPLLETIAADPVLDALVSSLEQRPNGDIIVVPSIRGHVVNLGDTSDVQDKFARLQTFYRRVMPIKGWTFYDTVSVKWRGRVVAKRRQGNLSPVGVAYTHEDFLDIDDEAGEFPTYDEMLAGISADDTLSIKYLTR